VKYRIFTFQYQNALMSNTILDTARETLKQESEAIHRLINYLDEDFEASVDLIHKSKGRVIVTGIGKSAIIANKIVATFNSTGTPSIFMHAADAIHGDLGIIQPDDIVQTIFEGSGEDKVKVSLKKERNRIKVVGKNAKGEINFRILALDDIRVIPRN